MLPFAFCHTTFKTIMAHSNAVKISVYWLLLFTALHFGIAATSYKHRLGRNVASITHALAVFIKVPNLLVLAGCL